MKRRLLFFLSACLLLSGCDSESHKSFNRAFWGPSEADIMKPFIGQHYSDVISNWGPPTQVLDDGGGGKIMSWTTSKTVYMPGTAHTYTSPTVVASPGVKVVGPTHYSRTVQTPGTTITENHSRTFWVDENGIINRWASN